MAPPGTYTLLPQPVQRPKAIDLTFSDPPVEPDSEEEDTSRSNIRPNQIEQRASRVEETPQKRFDMSGFVYNANNKRAAIDLTTPPRYQKTVPAPRQSGPARAQQVQIDMDLNDIPDFDMRRKVQRLKAIATEKSYQELYEALVKKRGNYEDALDYVTALPSSEDELFNSSPFPAKSPEPARLPPTKTAQRGLKQPTQSIQNRFTNQNRYRVAEDDNVPTAPSPQQPKKRGKLVRGRDRGQAQATPPPAKPAEPNPEDEGIVISSASEAESEEEIEVNEDELLEFFNTCTLESMADLSSQKEEDIQVVLDQRPFRSLAAIRKVQVAPPQETGKKRTKKRIPFGEKLVDSAMTMWHGFGAVDQLVTECKNLGKPVAAAMSTWGVNVFGASTEGELALTSLDDLSDTNSNRDSGIGTPHSHGSDTELDPRRKTKSSSSKSTFVKQPSNMSKDIELKDYQLVGLNWLNLLWQNGVSGILADDMGLGKTCQVISFLSHLKQQNVPGPHLVVVPGSTLENWLREFEHFSPELKKHVEPYYGLQAARYEQQQMILDNLDDIYVIVTTYDLAFKPADNSFLRKCKPQACIYDEGHALRNSNTQRYKSLMKIPAKMRLLLTGTPLQNSLRELASILAFIMPNIFQEVADNLEVVFKHKAKVTEADTHSALLSTQRIERARSMMTPFILRRKKDQVLKHLPKKTNLVEYCELTESQSRLYNAQLEKQRQVLLDRQAGKPPKEHANVMMKLRQAAIHPLLFRDRYTDAIHRKMSKACLRESTFQNSDSDVIFEELQVYQDYQSHHLAMKYPKSLGKFALKNDEWMDSGKVKKLAELLRKYKENGDRTLVFSQFTSVMDILQWVLDTLDISYSRIDGQTPISERQPLIDQFTEDESISVFMLSTKSGGQGINITAANKVIIFDSSFNPQEDVQAENRAHRVGQTREVEIIRLVTKGTVEEMIHALGMSKLELDKMVSGEEGATETKKKGDKGEKISASEMLGIEAVEQMMEAQLKKGKEGSDIKDDFLDGLKAAGLDMSAA
jgi:SWI/SNF-related matrix-associated actin-dependent regulator 1 of chromatin subfamily A